MTGPDGAHDLPFGVGDPGNGFLHGRKGCRAWWAAGLQVCVWFLDYSCRCGLARDLLGEYGAAATGA
jgi:hypothetical protein